MSTAYHPQSDGQIEVVNSQAPLVHTFYLPGESVVEDVDRKMQEREQVVEMLKFHLMRAQDMMKSMADKNRTDINFKGGV
ncbi:hypothetical protein Tco_1148906 [Tanacetum coccineum]